MSPATKAVRELHLPESVNNVLPVTRVQRREAFKGGESWTKMTGVPIAQFKTEVLVVTNNHFLIGTDSKECLLGERGTVPGLVVATDSENDLALIVGKLDAGKKWPLTELATSNTASGDAATAGFPMGKALFVGGGRVVDDGWMNRRYVTGESGGAVYQRRKLVGVMSACTPDAATIADPRFQASLMQQPDVRRWATAHPGTPQQVITSYYSSLESSGRLGAFVPVSKVHALIDEAAVSLALDYPVFTQFFKESSHEAAFVGSD